MLSAGARRRTAPPAQRRLADSAARDGDAHERRGAHEVAAQQRGEAPTAAAAKDLRGGGGERLT